uniref:NADH-ubiquinone oxidoreductase chain 2 n=1 Tax=Thyropygus sp. DVL-2001 TaxID=174155 RepID=Q8WA79_9MYRI|nr:NADH dehydrogenase subunit 2 [Thyropygus sp. DVL-2001]AAL18228.1 NADH dehydrogenase subunit 2 [Thyropygus sp. DVL-2001]
MHLTLNKLLPIYFVLCGTMITLSSSSWMMAWTGLEINMLAFIPIIMTNTKLSNESALKYFFIQATGSIIIFLSTIILMQANFSTSMDVSNLLANSLIPLALALKLGAAPMHFWFPQMVEGLSWLALSLLLTWQKMAPLFLMSSYSLLTTLIYVMVVLSAITGAMGGLNQLLLKKILAYSSINHLAWMIMSAMISMNILLTYFIIYIIITLMIILLLMSNNLTHLSQLMANQYSLSLIAVGLFLNLLSLGGLPPFLGFLPKWLVLMSLASNAFFMIMIILVMCSVLTLYFYMRISFNLLMMNPKLSWFNKSLLHMTWPVKVASMCPIITLPLMTMM